MTLKASLASHWKFDEASGNALDAWGSNTFTDNNTVGSAAGKISSARDFEDGNSEYFSNSGWTWSTEWTVAFWLKIESLPGSYAGLFTRDNNGSPRAQSTIYLKSDGRLAAYVDGTGAFFDGGGNTVLSTGVWYYIVFAYSTAAGIQVWINNVIDIDTTDSYTPRTDAALTEIGRDAFNASRYFDGLIDELSVWSRVVTSAERAELYNAGEGLDFDLWDVAYDLTDSLLSYWELEEASGTRVDSHGTNDLTDNNSVGSTTGIVGTAAQFNGSNYLTKTTPGFGFSGDFSIQVWLKYTYDGLPDTESLLSTYDGGATSWYFRYSFDIVGFSIYGGTFPSVGQSGTSGDGSWHHFVVRRQNGNLVMFKDGVQTSSIVASTETLTDKTLYLGGLGDGGQGYDGALDEVAFWDRGLSAGEIAWLCNSGAGRSYADLTPSTVVYEQTHFRFRNDDGSESTATWKAAEDTDSNVSVLTPIRLRIQTDATGDAPSQALKLQARKVGDPTWVDVN